jgi:hypothetical protein
VAIGCIAGCGVACRDCADAEACEQPTIRNAPTRSPAAAERDPKVLMCVDGERMPEPLALGMLASRVKKNSSKSWADKQLIMGCRSVTSDGDRRM